VGESAGQTQGRLPLFAAESERRRNHERQLLPRLRNRRQYNHSKQNKQRVLISICLAKYKKVFTGEIYFWGKLRILKW